MAEGKKTPLDQGFIARVAAGIKYAVTGNRPEVWFGPGEPQPPAAPPEVKGRQFDYPVSVNLQTQPRGGEAISFAELRALAHNCDLVRLCIETRKDQLCKLNWSVKPREEIAKVGGAQSKTAEAQAREARDLLKKPDRVRRWNQWLRMLVEDMLVIDAATIYPRPNLGGKLFALEIMDGATIKPILDDGGRTPFPPEPAYQQVLKGVAAANYTLEELVYFPRNPLSWRAYGYSPVEQIIIIVNIVLRRQLHLLQFYTEGNLPDTLLEVPENWSTQQIEEWQRYWDSLFAGNTAQRRRGTWVPKGMTPHNMKEAALKDPIDEWFARVVCFCFSLSPQPFVQQINRATAETAQEAALEEGLAPLQEWVKDAADEGLERGGFDLVEFAWEEESTTKPKEQAEIDEINLRSGLRKRSEIRADRGWEEDNIPDFIMTVSGPVLVADIGQEPPELEAPPAPPTPPEAAPPEAGDKGAQAGKSAPPENQAPAEKLEKAAKGKKKVKIERLDRERRAVKKARAALQKLMQQAFAQDVPAAAAQLGKALGLAKADEDQAAKIERLLQELHLAGIEATRKEAAQILAQMAQNGGQVAFAQVGFYGKAVGREFDELAAAGLLTADELAIVSQVNKLAVEWTENRAAELVKEISEATRDYLRADVAQAEAEGWSTAQLSQALQENYGFSEGRSNTIARTEIGQADVEGNMMAYRESGVVEGKEWILGSEHTDDDECTENAAAGVIPLDEAFPSGDQNPLAHPNCVCDVLPVLAAKE